MYSKYPINVGRMEEQTKKDVNIWASEYIS